VNSYRLVQQGSGVTKFKQVENKASKHVFGEEFCHESCMGTEIRLQFGRHIIRLHLETKGIPLLHTRV